MALSVLPNAFSTVARKPIAKLFGGDFPIAPSSRFFALLRSPCWYAMTDCLMASSVVALFAWRLIFGVC